MLRLLPHPVKMLRICAETELHLVNVLTRGFSPFQVGTEGFGDQRG
jgi:hypothetical protein